MDLKSTFGNRVVEQRKLQHLTQQQLAYRSQISISLLRSIEHAKVNTTLDVIERISKALDMDPEQLIKKLNNRQSYQKVVTQSYRV